MPTLEIVSAFLASPGDLEDERAAARKVVEQVNTRVGRPHGLRIELYGWEQEPPAAGRAQGLINPHVDEAVLFIGLLGRRWGTPSGNGHTSGFQEEWERALARHEEGGEPTIWLFFKQIEAAQREDAGPELQKVLDFRKTIEKDFVAFYREFSDLSDWQFQLFEYLAGYLAEHASRRLAPTPEPDRSPVVSVDSGGEAKRSEVLSDAGLQQLWTALESAQGAISAAEPSGPDIVDSARILLASFTWVRRRGAAETLGTHELNLFYRMRNHLEVGDDERLELVRSMLTQRLIRPGWFWLVTAGDPLAALVSLAREDTDEDVRARAVDGISEIIRETGWPAHLDLPAVEFVRDLLTDQVAQVWRAGLELAVVIGGDDMVEALRVAARDSRTSVHATAALVQATVNIDPDAALATYLAEPALAASTALDVAVFVAHASRLSESSIEALHASDYRDHQFLALQLDADRGTADRDRVLAAVQGPDRRIRRVALGIVGANDWALEDEVLEQVLDDVDPFEGRRLRARCWGSRDQAWYTENVNWYFAYGDAYYEAWARRYSDQFASQLRRDIQDRFETFRGESAAEIERMFGASGHRLIRERERRGQVFLVAALGALEGSVEPADREMLEPLLGHEAVEVRLAALKVFAKLDRPAAARVATEIAIARDGGVGEEEMRDAAQVALGIDPALSSELVDSRSSEVVARAIRKLKPGEDAVGLLSRLLNSDRANVRDAATDRLGELLDVDGLRGVLDAYIEQETYFYNVVAALDELVFGPKSSRFLAGERPAGSERQLSLGALEGNTG